MDFNFKDEHAYVLLAFKPKCSIDIIQAIGCEARSHNAEVSSTLIIHINSKFIDYDVFPYQVLWKRKRIDA